MIIEKEIQMKILNENGVDWEHLHPITKAESVLTEDGSTLDTFLDGMKYTSKVPTTIALGGLDKGFVAPADGIGAADLLYRILHQYVAPRITLSATSSGGTFEKGTTINNVSFTANGYVEAENIINMKIYYGSTIMNQENYNTSGNKSLSYAHGNINTNSTFKATASDSKQTVTSSTVSYNFVYPAYVGSVSAATTIPTQTEIKSMIKKVQSPGNITNTFTISNQRMVIACPPGWTIKTIIDPNNFDITPSFAVHAVSVTGLDATSQSYKVYVSEPTTQTNFLVKFNI